ncbi:MAG: UDP-2,4-diacetamido-2,4,6-trideoxy-beta-L-altropyranose hydrolase [Allosphingosinicella sp.]
MRIAIRADASAAIGAGHALRCLALADTLAAAGGRVSFIGRLALDEAAARIRSGGHALVPLTDAPDEAEAAQAWDVAPLPEGEQARDAAATLEAIGDEPVDWLIVDHYGLGQNWESAVRGRARRIAVIDDLANRAHDCDLLLDQTAGRRGDDYRALVPRGARILLGPNHALLRPEFAEARPAALARRRAAGPAGRLLLSLGASDIGGHTATILEALLDDSAFARIDVVLGSGAASLDQVTRRVSAAGPRAQLHVDSRTMARLMAEADVAIGTSGVSNWERCCLGLPAVLFTVAANQAFGAGQMHRLAAAVTVAGPAQAAQEAAALAADAARLAAMSAAAAAICDGRGTERVAAAMTGRDQVSDAAGVQLRPATPADSERIWLWRNDPLMREMAKTHDPVPWPVHNAWYARRLVDPGTTMLVAERAGAPVGMVRFDREPDGDFTVSINLAPEARGTGLGRVALAAACDKIQAQYGGAALSADIHASNEASRRIFEACDFAADGAPDDNGFGRFRRPVRKRR